MCSSLFSVSLAPVTVSLYRNKKKILSKLEVEFENRGSPFQRGVGGSAALCVSIAGAFTQFAPTDPSKTDGIPFLTRVNDLAFMGERLFHGKPSGVDNTTSCYGKFPFSSLFSSVNLQLFVRL